MKKITISVVAVLALVVMAWSIDATAGAMARQLGRAVSVPFATVLARR